jgi:ankyrin repeat protein
VPPAPDAALLTSFFKSVSFDDARGVARLLGSRVHPNQPNPLGGEPGIVLAVREGSMNVLQVFLAHPGTDIDARAANGNTALMLAAYKGNAAAVEALLARGAAVNQPGWTALHYAAASGNEDILRRLLASGARVDAVSPAASGAYTPLMMAAREGQDGAGLILIGAGADRRRKNSEGLDAIELAERAGKPRVARALERAPRPDEAKTAPVPRK